MGTHRVLPTTLECSSSLQGQIQFRHPYTLCQPFWLPFLAQTCSSFQRQVHYSRPFPSHPTQPNCIHKYVLILSLTGNPMRMDGSLGWAVHGVSGSRGACLAIGILQGEKLRYALIFHVNTEKFNYFDLDKFYVARYI